MKSDITSEPPSTRSQDTDNIDQLTESADVINFTWKTEVPDIL